MVVAQVDIVEFRKVRFTVNVSTVTKIVEAATGTNKSRKMIAFDAMNAFNPAIDLKHIE